jgi:hypothetical protein
MADEFGVGGFFGQQGKAAPTYPQSQGTTKTSTNRANTANPAGGDKVVQQARATHLSKSLDEIPDSDGKGTGESYRSEIDREKKRPYNPVVLSESLRGTPAPTTPAPTTPAPPKPLGKSCDVGDFFAREGKAAAGTRENTPGDVEILARGRANAGESSRNNDAAKTQIAGRRSNEGSSSRSGRGRGAVSYAPATQLGKSLGDIAGGTGSIFGK